MRKKRLFLFDLDGVFYKGKETRIKIGGGSTVASIRDAGKKLFILTNNSTDTVETVLARLREFDIPVNKEEILTSALLTAEYLKKKHGKVTYFLVGEDGLDREMKRCGHKRVRQGRADFVVVGLDRQVTYQKLDAAARLIREGSGLVATHVSRLYMYRTGPALATGPLVKAIEYGGQRRATVIGKPSPLMFRAALERAGCKPSDAVMVGDQVDTDLEGASRAGIDYVLVTSGVDKNAAGYSPLGVLDNVDELASLI